MTWEVFMDDVYFDGVKLPRSALPSPNIQLSALIDTVGFRPSLRVTALKRIYRETLLFAALQT